MRITVSLLLAGMLLIGLNGCGHRNSSAASVSNARQAGQQFLATLQSLPPNQRQDYVRMHPEKMQTLSQSGDAALMAQYNQLMQPIGAH